MCGVAAAAASVWIAPGPIGWFGAMLALLMATIAFCDWRAFIIPDVLSGAAFLLGLISAILAEPESGHAVVMGYALLRAIILGGLFWLIRIVYRRFRGRHGLGLGDVKLAAVAGAWLDWATLPIMLEIAAMSALLAALGYRAVTKRQLQATTRLPFGLFLAPAIWIGWLIEMLP